MWLVLALHPGFIIYRLIYDSGSVNIIHINSDMLKAIFFMLTAAIMPVCGALRLAIFNLDSTQATTFKGLPIPANALAVISIVIARSYSHSDLFNSITASPVFLFFFTIALSILMVSRIPMLSLKVSNLKLKGNEGRYILICLVLAAFLIFGPMGAPLIIPLYIISSAVSLLF